MCFTGGFALAMMTEPSVVAPVVSQPSLPLVMGLGADKRAAAIDASAEEIACAKKRFTEEGLSMIGLRFFGDSLVRDERFATYKSHFGSSFKAIEIAPEEALPAYDRPAHSVLTVNLREDGETKKAEQEVIAFFKSQTAGK
jgi:hypothetical protein